MMNQQCAPCGAQMTEKELLQDGLASQKHITDSYNTFAGECVNPQLRGTFLNILDEEHHIQAELFNTMQSKGWYQVEQAPAQKVQQTRQKYSTQP
jgi:spore coat protein CotF